MHKSRDPTRGSWLNTQALTVIILENFLLVVASAALLWLFLLSQPPFSCSEPTSQQLGCVVAFQNKTTLQRTHLDNISDLDGEVLHINLISVFSWKQRNIFFFSPNAQPHFVYFCLCSYPWIYANICIFLTFAGYPAGNCGYLTRCRTLICSTYAVCHTYYYALISISPK